MNRLFTFRKVILAFCFFVAINKANAGNFNCALTGTNSGNWNSASTWTLVSGTDADGIPDADDNVTISQGRVIVNVTSEVNNLNLLADNNIRVTSVQTLRIYGRIDAIVGSLTTGTCASPIQGNGTTAGVIEFDASTTRDVTTAFYRSDYTFSNRPVDVNFGRSSFTSTSTISIFGFQSATVQVNNCNVILKDNYYVGYGSTVYNVTIESTATVSQNFNANKTFGFRSSTSTDAGINNFIIRGTFTTGFDVIAANSISVPFGGKFIVSDATKSTGLSNSAYEFNGTLEYDRTIAYTAGGEFGTFSVATINSLKIKGLITLPDLPASRTYTIASNITFNGGKLNLFEHELNITASNSTTITGAGVDNYIIAQTNGARIPRITAQLNNSRTGIIIPMGTSSLFTPVFVTSTNTSSSATIVANMYADGAASSSCGTTTPSSTQLVNVAYSVTATPANQALDIQFHYPQTATSVRGSAYVPTTAKVVGCNGSSLIRYIGALGESSNNSYNTFFVAGSFGGANPNLTSFNIITSEPSLTANLPVISNVGAGAIATNSFTVGYTINANGSNTTPIVRYGTAANNLNQSVTGSVISGTTNLNSQVDITGLTGGTQYFYRVEASNAIGNATPSVTNNVTTLTPVVPAPTNGLVAYYGFNNNTNSHNGNHNLTSASTPSYVTGKVGNGVSFSNAVDRTLSSTTLTNALPSSGPFTICFWQNEDFVSASTDLPTYFEMFGSAYVRAQKSSQAYTSLNIGYAYSNTVITSPIFEGNSGFGNYNPATTTGWNHFAIVHNPGAGNVSSTQNFAMYINGVFVAEVNRLNNQFIHKFNTMFTIGGGTNAAGAIQANKRFDGIIDEFYVYNRVLTPAEIVNVRNEVNGHLLPTTLVNFSATLKNNTTQLSWQTKQEINTSHFDVEYGFDGVSFEKLATVFAAGNSIEVKNYTLSHLITENVNYYYRLKMVDKDGKFTYSNILKVSNSKNDKFKFEVYPTLTKGEITGTVANNKIEIATIQIINNNGQVVSKQSFQTVNGSNTFKANISNQSNGMYLVQIISSNGIFTQKIVKH